MFLYVYKSIFFNIHIILKESGGKTMKKMEYKAIGILIIAFINTTILLHIQNINIQIYY